MASASTPSDSPQGSSSTADNTYKCLNDAGDLVTVITRTRAGSLGGEELGAHAEGALPTIVPDGVMHSEALPVSPFSIARDPIINDLAASSRFHPSFKEAPKLVESTAGNPAALCSDVAAAIGSREDVEDRAQALGLARLRAVIFPYASKLPIVGPYFIAARPVSGPNVDALATETTPLLGALRDPKSFATEQAKGLLLRLLSPLLSSLPDVDTLDNVESDNCGALFKIFVECYVLVSDGGGWLFTHLQEHSLLIAPTVSLGHLSTTDLAASTIGTAVASVTGYSIVQGFISSLDKVLAGASSRRVAKMACAQAAIVTGFFLFPITHLWTAQSASILQRLGQSQEVALPASQFLRVAAGGLPGYAIGEIAKRYLASQGLSHVHTRILSAIAPLNLVLNYLLVDGPIPALRLGFTGAPLCTVLSHNALATTMVVYIVLRVVREEVDHLRGENINPEEPVREASNFVHPTNGNHVPEPQPTVAFFTGLGSLIYAGVSGISKSASQLWSKDFGGVVASILGPNALATQAIVLTTATTLYQAPKAMSNVSSDRIKKWMKKGDVQRAKIAASVAFVGTSLEVIVISNVLLSFGMSWGKLFNNNPIILQNVSSLLPVIAVFQAFHGIGAWVDSSLWALGKATTFPSINASTDYLLGMPLGLYLALWRQWGLVGLWVGLTISLACSCLVATIMLVRTNWKHTIGERNRITLQAEQEVVEPMTEQVGSGAFV